LVRAIRDLCSYDPREASETYRWVHSEQFKTLSAYAQVDEDRARETMEALWRYPVGVRRGMLREIVRATLGRSPRVFHVEGKKKGATGEG